MQDLTLSEGAVKCFEVPVVVKQPHEPERDLTALVLVGLAGGRNGPAGAFWLFEEDASCERVAWDAVSGPWYQWGVRASLLLDIGRQGVVFAAP
jgi:hypothetical protein